MKFLKNISLIALLTTSVSANSQTPEVKNQRSPGQVKIIFENQYDADTKNLLLKELGKYPKSLLSSNLDSVIILNFKTQQCGRSHPYSKHFVLSEKCEHKQGTIHHELSSVLLYRYDLEVDRDFGDKLIQQFYHINNGVYSYDKNSGAGDFTKGDPRSDYFYKRAYAMTNFENDFNVIAEFLWTEGEATVNFMINNPDKPVSKKIRLVLDFYQRLHPSFTIEFFKRQNI